uniref:Uncharacterized protein n=1 Tax=Panagrolaimus sp. PS1159 TaxID=55785 RepID=A0AC35GCZ0_9BILA
MNSIKILNSLELHPGLTDIYLKTLLPKLDLSQLKEIIVDYAYSFMKREVLEMITPTSLERFILGCDSGAEINPALFVFQKCPKLKTIGVGLTSTFNPDIVPVLTKNVLKEILLIKREKNSNVLTFLLHPKLIEMILCIL